MDALLIGYLILSLVTVAINFDQMSDFIQTDIKEEVSVLSNSINSSGKVLEPISIFLFIILFPLMITIINLGGMKR